MSIKLLSRETIEKITAGEVIERPVSVAKELIENSIDAGASGISVEIKGGGIEYLRVTDNGCGIDAKEIKLAFQNHATSKLSDASELANVMTMGFRGEALPSIAAVSKVSVSTKTKDAETGVKLVNEGGTITQILPAGCPEGTTITVSELFYNIPVRRTFLRKPAYEQSLITELVQKLAMGNPGISFRLTVNGKMLFRTYGDGNVLHAAMAIFGNEYVQGLKEIDQSEGAFSIRGFLGVGEQAYPTRSRQSFFLNGRLINCRALSQALEEACRGRVTVGKYPSCVLFVTAPASSVDVNVHPGKLEVRFRDEAAFRLTAGTLLSRAFAGDSMAESLLTQIEIAAPAHRVITEPVKQTSADSFEHLRQMDIYIPEQTENKPAAAGQVNEPGAGISFTGLVDSMKPPVYSAPEPSVPKEAMPVRPEPEPEPEKKTDVSFRLIGVYLDTYIIVEMRESLILIDQHAAHERLNYEKYTKALSEGVASQELLVPIMLNLTPREMQILSDSGELLREAGYELEPFGENTVKVTAVPFIYGSSDLNLLFEEMIDELAMLKKAEKERRLASIIQASCKHAVKGGEKLSREEIASLLERMLVSDAPPTCPHGRPIMKVYTKRMIEQLFKRIQ